MWSHDIVSHLLRAQRARVAGQREMGQPKHAIQAAAGRAKPHVQVVAPRRRGDSCCHLGSCVQRMWQKHPKHVASSRDHLQGVPAEPIPVDHASCPEDGKHPGHSVLISRNGTRLLSHIPEPVDLWEAETSHLSSPRDTSKTPPPRGC